jgi:RimJ/RimL family protein N-acetyltransferase
MGEQQGGLTIRPLAVGELDAFFSYLNDHLADNGQGGTALFQPMARSQSRFPPEKEAGFRTGMATPVDAPGWRRAWIALDDCGAIAGHIDLRARPEGAASHRALLGMGVHRDWRKQGLGARLVDAALGWAATDTALDWIDLEVLSVNAPARRLYAQSGFATTGQKDDMFRIDGEQLGYTFMSRPVRR